LGLPKVHFCALHDVFGRILRKKFKGVGCSLTEQSKERKKLVTPETPQNKNYGAIATKFCMSCAVQDV